MTPHGGDRRVAVPRSPQSQHRRLVSLTFGQLDRLGAFRFADVFGLWVSSYRSNRPPHRVTASSSTTSDWGSEIPSVR